MVLLLIPVAATLLLVMIFFFTFKMRYYGDPFMIIIAAWGVNRYLKLRAGVYKKRGAMAPFSV
jgi:hypothetical protein